PLPRRARAHTARWEPPRPRQARASREPAAQAGAADGARVDRPQGTRVTGLANAREPRNRFGGGVGAAPPRTLGRHGVSRWPRGDRDSTWRPDPLRRG